MKKVKLHGVIGKGKYALIDDADYAAVSMFRWHLSTKGYVLRQVWNPKTKTARAQMLHHIITGRPDKGLQVDHANRNKLDNRRVNLRVVDQSKNQANTRARRNSKSGLKGVHFVTSEKRWRAQISNNKVRITLGRFDTKEDAARAYNAAALEFYGDFALLNKV